MTTIAKDHFNLLKQANEVWLQAGDAKGIENVASTSSATPFFLRTQFYRIDFLKQRLSKS